jgi:hypothetical protein
LIISVLHNLLNYFIIFFVDYVNSVNKVFIFASPINNNMNTTEIRKKVAAYTEVGFTIQEAFAGIRNAKRNEGKKETTADKIAASQQRAGTYEYGFTGKEYGTRKWGKQ